MARAERYQFVVLAEGKRDYDFASRYLRARYGKRSTEVFRAQTPADGEGSGEQHVRQRFPSELQTLRSYPGFNRYLVVMTDGDRLSAEERRRQLERQIPRLPGDKVAIFVPCRNLESWFAWLDGDFQNEKTDHKSRYSHAKPGKLGQRMESQCRHRTPEEMPASLRDACEELRRLP